MIVKIDFDIHALCLASLHAFGTPEEDDTQARYDSARAALEAEYRRLYDALVSGAVDYFYYSGSPSSNGRSLVQCWTRSTRPGVTVQRTAFMNVPGGELLPMSHHDIRVFDDMVADMLPDAVEIIAA